MRKVQRLISDLRANYSQEEIATQTGGTQSLISRWEAGKAPAAADVALEVLSMHLRMTRKSKRGNFHNHGKKEA